MDAVEFIRERNRMCRAFGKSCDGCPAEISAYYQDKTDHCGDPDMSCANCCREFWMQEVE